MTEDRTPPKLELLTAYAGLVILVGIVLSWEVSRVCFFFLAMVGIWQMIRFPASLSKDQKLFIYPILFFFFSALISYLVNESPKRGPQILIETFALLLLSAPLMVLYNRFPARKVPTLLMFVLCVIAAGIYSAYDLWSNPIKRAGGSTGQAILFSTIALGSLVVVAANYQQFVKKSSIQLLFFLFSLCCGIFAILMTGSRGSWIGLPVICVFFILFYFRSTSWYKKLAGILIVSIILPLVIYQVPYVSQRVDLAIDEIASELSETPRLSRETSSIAIRFALWEGAFDIFLENPVFGAGPGNYRMVMKE